MRTIQVINKQKGTILAEFVLNPIVPVEFGIEFDANLCRVFVVRSVQTSQIEDRLEIGDANVKIKIIDKVL